ncbi:MAG: alkaline phosphatase family protein [Patescibacteria group bacterium]
MLIIGLDGATWEIINPNLDKLPNFRQLKNCFEHYTIHLLQKPWSASVWCSMFSGQSPEEHQHLDFVKDGKVLTRYDVKVEFIWDILNREGINVKAINVPFIVPPYNFQVDFDPPGHGVPITQEELNTEITSLTEKINEVASKEKPELLIGVYTALDKMSHLHWGEQSLIEYYQKIDNILPELTKLDDRILILSDHGFTDYDKAPVQTLPKVTSTGDQLKGDHHPDAICLSKNVPFKVKQPADVFRGLLKLYSQKQ